MPRYSVIINGKERTCDVLYDNKIDQKAFAPLPLMRLAVGFGKERFPIIQVSEYHRTNTPQKIGSPTVPGRMDHQVTFSN